MVPGMGGGKRGEAHRHASEGYQQVLMSKFKFDHPDYTIIAAQYNPRSSRLAQCEHLGEPPDNRPLPRMQTPSQLWTWFTSGRRHL